MNKGEISKNINKQAKKVTEQISNLLEKYTDIEVLIIKSHILCEYYINQILVLKGIPYEDNLSFNQKIVRVDKSLENKDSDKLMIKKLHQLNRIRNRASHVLEYEPSEIDIDSLGLLFGKQYVIDKNQEENTSKLFIIYLSKTVVDVALFLCKLIQLEKIGGEE